ncbi:hypothetical protein [Azospirillum picis]|uniref:Uncharacterized protein n=1 Tax=Azospirillum picis TaxID=488438 RepID=A0ABU0MDA5_9PROT|nr:hypothetical protein [Azospirillum picis]MBP2297614.1 hypothetical protein [Azospirillum picis]MDQ0531363.1 hypothetical protein [Azospirillum picis]
MPHGTLDRETLEAVGILARAVERERVPGVLECRLLASALHRTLESGRESDLGEASRIFRTLDSELRDRIVTRSRLEAHQARRRTAAAVAKPVAEAVTVEPAVHRKPEPKDRTGSSFLTALNGLRPGKTAPTSRCAARDRLRAAVDSQRRVGERVKPALK